MLEPLHQRQPSSHVEGIQIVEEVVHGSLEDKRLVGDERDTVVGAESHINENHTPENAEPVTSVSQKDTPKKSYALIVSSQTKKGPNKIYVASNTRMAPAKAEKQPVKSMAQAESKDAQYRGIISKKSCTCMKYIIPYFHLSSILPGC